MTPTIYTEDWRAYTYLVEALSRVKPISGLAIRPYQALDHPIVRERFLNSVFIAYADDAEPCFSFPAIAEALDRKFPDIALCGASAIERALVRSVVQVIDEGHLMLAASRIHDFPGYEGPAWHQGSRAPEAFQETFFKKVRIVERYARDDAFLLGSRPSLVDVIVTACVWFAGDIGLEAIPADCPKLTAWRARHGDDVFRHPSR